MWRDQATQLSLAKSLVRVSSALGLTAGCRSHLCATLTYVFAERVYAKLCPNSVATWPDNRNYSAYTEFSVHRLPRPKSDSPAGT